MVVVGALGALLGSGCLPSDTTPLVTQLHLRSVPWEAGRVFDSRRGAAGPCSGEVAWEMFGGIQRL